MQDIHSIGGGGGKGLFSGGGVGGRGGAAVIGDRRLRPHNHSHHHPNHQALKCPRCDSLNTKFCYYNNYNLSQPRHFCKSCRRYWTKGGILRNVPVGGGCRKSKRSSSSSSASKQPKQPFSSATTDMPTTTTTSLPPQEKEREPKSSNNNNYSHSSSESSSLTAATTTANNTVIEAVSNSGVVFNTTDNNTVLNGIGESKLFLHANNINQTNYESVPPLLEQPGPDCGGIFPEIGSFTSLISAVNEQLPFGFCNFLNTQQGFEHVHHQQNHHQLVGGGGGEEMKMQEIPSVGSGGLIDQTVQVELLGLDYKSGGFGPLDWEGSGGGEHDHGNGSGGGCLFDLPGAVDQAYWSQSQWSSSATTSDQDHHHHPSLYLP